MQRKILFSILLCLALFVPIVTSATTLPADDTVPPEVAAWLQANAIPFETSEPIANHQDLDSLQRLVGDARIVSLGEATHGTAEFFTMKHRILRYLVEDMGFRVFMIEADYPSSLAVNNFVLHGEGDPHRALAGMGFWTWNTQEVLDMILWMRDYNINHPDDMVQFVGFDNQMYRHAITYLHDYFRVVYPERADRVPEMLACFNGTGYGRPPTDGCRMQIERIGEWFKAERENFIAASSERDYQLAHYVVTFLLGLDDLYRSSPADSFETRDRLMANNVIWFADEVEPDVGIVLWAHNAHIQTEPLYTLSTMGVNLDQHYSDDLVTMGFAFWEGSFNAWKHNGTRTTSDWPEPNTVIAPRQNSHEFYFRAAKMPHFFLDLNAAPDNVAVAGWLNRPLHLREIGAVYNPDATIDDYTVRTRLSTAFDVMIYIEESTPSVLLPFPD